MNLFTKRCEDDGETGGSMVPRLAKGESSTRSKHQRASSVRSLMIAGLLLSAVAAWTGYSIVARARSSYALAFQRENQQLTDSLGESVVGSEAETSDNPKVVAFVISLTHLGDEASSYLDAAEVLLQSIQRVCAASAYACEPIAFVLPKVPQGGRRILEDIGWRVVEKDLPVAVEDIVDDFYRGAVVNSGCCGADELVKLHAYTLMEYHRVLHLDVDTLLLHPMDELMELDASLSYTTDPAMATKGSRALPAQGGFLLVKPDMEIYDRLCDVIREGDWKAGVGWGGSKIGWFYGGPTIQGVLPYFYHILAPGTAVQINRCIYNHMCDSDECRAPQYAVTAELQQPHHEEEPVVTIVNPADTEVGGGEEEAISRADGRNSSMDNHIHDGAVADGDVRISPIKSVHFTQSCMKPWTCYGGKGRPESGCAELQQAWFDGRKEMFAARGVPYTEPCAKREYSPMPRDSVESRT